MPDVFIGDNWNTKMPTLVDDRRFCPNCNGNYMHTITAYPDLEYWRCHHCNVSTEHVPEKGRFGHRVNYNGARHTNRAGDQRAEEFKRNANREYLTRKKRRELGLDDEKS